MTQHGVKEGTGEYIWTTGAVYQGSWAAGWAAATVPGSHFLNTVCLPDCASLQGRLPKLLSVPAGACPATEG